jgi:two-component system NarL family sensor kinase
VLEIYTDVDSLVKQNERALFTIMAGVGLILILLYAGLILVVRRATGIIESQQNIIHERTAALESLSAQMLRSEETEKKKLAAVLHEGLAQTLIAIKTHLEQGREQSSAGKIKRGQQESLIPVLQGAINDVRTIATDLRPASLDELGLLPTIRWLIREFQQLHSKILVEHDISLREDAVPAHLKIVIYRIIESLLKRIGRYEDTDRVRLALRLVGQSVILEFDDTSHDSAYGVAERQSNPHREIHIVEMRERTTLSGGIFSITSNKAGGATFRASWTASIQASPAH